MTDCIQFKIRIPAELHQRLVLSAALNYRSVTAEISTILTRYYGAELSDEERKVLARAGAILSRTGDVNTAYTKNIGEE